MPQPSDALDLRRAHESVLLDALGVGHPLALAEAYHRTVPAAHAVARRLMSTTDDIERLLLAAYEQLWNAPPSTGPLEGWIRRAVWTLGVERLRAAGAAPASPSLAGLVPDLPAPDVRFLDAAERAIAELPDDERRALLLAHDKGVPTAGQEPGAPAALGRALMALAGPENAGSDATAIQEDPCEDLSAVGDWCLGLATTREETEVNQALEERPGCAARSRAMRRGRRRVEGLPATPDMGQRVLVSVLTAGGRPAVVPDNEVIRPAALTGTAPTETETDPIQADPTETDPVQADHETAAAPADPFAPVDDDPFAPVDDDPFAPTDVDPFAPVDDPFGPDAGAADATDPVGLGVVDDDTDAPRADTSDEIDDPFSALADETGPLPPLDATAADPTTDPAPDGVTDTADLAQSTGEVDWRPDPGSTAELRLSDILAEGENDDDPFAELSDTDDDGPGPGTGDPYAALRGIDEDAAPGQVDPTMPIGTSEVLIEDEDLVGGYVEGQGTTDVIVRQPSRMAAVLAWILPIIGGTAIGVLVAIIVFGAP